MLYTLVLVFILVTHLGYCVLNYSFSGIVGTVKCISVWICWALYISVRLYWQKMQYGNGTCTLEIVQHLSDDFQLYLRGLDSRGSNWTIVIWSNTQSGCFFCLNWFVLFDFEIIIFMLWHWRFLGQNSASEKFAPSHTQLISVQAAGGIIAGATASCITTPLDTIKTRLQVLTTLVDVKLNSFHFLTVHLLIAFILIPNIIFCHRSCAFKL